MTQAEFQKVRTHLATLESMLAKSQSDPAGEELLLEFRRMCWAVLLVTDDGECQDQIDLLVQYSKDLFATPDGDDLLRDRIRTVLGTFGARLNALEPSYGKRWRDLRAA